ncbi:MAG: hypothetical protein FWG57_06935 [Endomicrobia bacterium]|nr:hypothetical protein [Bacillota bacterium]MCL1972702.1 hypothetical protein [Endomicrobiia bacterium]
MKKILFILLVLIFASCNVFASKFVNITRITNSVQIKTPDGEINTYKNISDIPAFIYGSQIFASGGTAEIKIFNTAYITLEKNQGVFITKDPATREIVAVKADPKSKVTQNTKIQVWLADSVPASFGSDTKVSFFERFPSINFKVLKGKAEVSGLGGKVYTLSIGEYYEAKQNIIR